MSKRGKPRLYQYKDGRSPFWYIQYYCKQRKRTVNLPTGCRIGAEDDKAELCLAGFILERDKPLNRQPEEVLLAQVLEDYWREHAQHTRSAQTIRHTLDRLQGPNGLRVYAVSDLRPNVQADYIRRLREQKFSRSTIHNEMAYLKAALRHAQKNNRIVSFPTIDVPTGSKPRERVLSPTEARALMEACEHTHTRDFILIALCTGQRKGVILNLKWFQVSFDNGLIDFRQEDETTKRSGLVAMNTILRNRLLELKERRSTEYVLEYEGLPLKDIKRSFATACRRAGIEGVTPHTLRHSMASWAAGEGISMHEIKNILGHASVVTTDKNYIKYSPNHTQRGVQTVELLLKSVSDEGGKL